MRLTPSTSKNILNKEPWQSRIMPMALFQQSLMISIHKKPYL